MMRRSFKATALSAHPPPPHSTPKACSRIRPCFRVQARCLLYTVFSPRVRARLHSAQDSWTHYSELWNVCTHVPSDFIPGYEHVCTRFLNPLFRTMNVYTHFPSDFTFGNDLDQRVWIPSLFRWVPEKKKLVLRWTGNTAEMTLINAS